MICTRWKRRLRAARHRAKVGQYVSGKVRQSKNIGVRRSLGGSSDVCADHYIRIMLCIYMFVCVLHVNDHYIHIILYIYMCVCVNVYSISIFTWMWMNIHVWMKIRKHVNVMCWPLYTYYTIHIYVCVSACECFKRWCDRSESVTITDLKYIIIRLISSEKIDILYHIIGGKLI